MHLSGGRYRLVHRMISFSMGVMLEFFADMDKACTQQYYEVSAADLPLCCPMNRYRLWDAHPRVYLSIEKVGAVTCPYCNAQYVLKQSD